MANGVMGLRDVFLNTEFTEGAEKNEMSAGGGGLAAALLLAQGGQRVDSCGAASRDVAGDESRS